MLITNVEKKIIVYSDFGRIGNIAIIVLNTTNAKSY